MIISECWDFKVWPKYNEWIYKHVLFKLKDKLSIAEKIFYKKTLSGALNNYGFLYNGQGKKFKAKALRKWLLSIHQNPMEEQRRLIDEAFETWRGSLEQIDDVCVIGVRI